MKRTRVAGVEEVPPGTARVVEVGGRALAVVNVDGAFFAVDNACAHRGGPLGEGDVDGPVVTCPWHAWRWDVRTGANVNNPAVKLACYPVTVENGALLVDLP